MLDDLGQFDSGFDFGKAASRFQPNFDESDPPTARHIVRGPTSPARRVEIGGDGDSADAAESVRAASSIWEWATSWFGEFDDGNRQSKDSMATSHNGERLTLETKLETTEPDQQTAVPSLWNWASNWFLGSGDSGEKAGAHARKPRREPSAVAAFYEDHYRPSGRLVEAHLSLEVSQLVMEYAWAFKLEISCRAETRQVDRRLGLRSSLADDVIEDCWASVVSQFKPRDPPKQPSSSAPPSSHVLRPNHFVVQFEARQRDSFFLTQWKARRTDVIEFAISVQLPARRPRRARPPPPAPSIFDWSRSTPPVVAPDRVEIDETEGPWLPLGRTIVKQTDTDSYYSGCLHDETADIRQFHFPMTMRRDMWYEYAEPEQSFASTATERRLGQEAIGRARILLQPAQTQPEPFSSAAPSPEFEPEEAVIWVCERHPALCLPDSIVCLSRLRTENAHSITGFAIALDFDEPPLPVPPRVRP